MGPVKYQIGTGVDAQGFQLGVLYHPPKNDLSPKELITVISGKGRHADETTLIPKEMLEHRPYIFHYETADRVAKATTTERESAGWFERKCREADCEWFVPIVKRMAAGEQVGLEEIQAGYFAHNGKPVHCGKWTDLV